MILDSGLELKKVQIVVSKRLRILPKIRGDNSARGWSEHSLQHEPLSAWFIGPIL